MVNNLVVFDFDNTLVDGNTDSLILDMLPGLREATRNYQVDNKGWGEVMNSALETIWQRGLQKKDIDECILSLKLTASVKSMLLSLNENSEQDVIIVSHSNDYFIEILLKDAGIKKEEFIGIFTYPAEWKKQGNLEVKRFHQEIHTCDFCPNDFCKGYFLSSFVKKIEEEKCKIYAKKIYVGDGRADYCATKALSKNDHVLCRYGFSLHKLITKNHDSTSISDVGFAFPKYTCWQNFDEMKEKLDIILNDTKTV